MKLELKSRLILLSIIPLIFVIILSSLMLFKLYENKKNLNLTKSSIAEAEAISKVIHSVQIERGIASSLIAKGDLDENYKTFITAKEASNKAIKEAKSVFIDTKNHKHRILDTLSKIQEQKSSEIFTYSALNARSIYTQHILHLLDFLKKIPSRMDDTQNRNYIQSYIHISSLKEGMGQTRAMMVDVFTTNNFEESLFISVKEQIKLCATDIQNFKTIAPKDILDYYENNFKGESLDEMYRMLEIAFEKRKSGNFEIDPSYWFIQITQVMDMLHDVEKNLFHSVNILIDKKLNTLFYEFAAILFFLIASAIGVTTLVVIIIREILFSTNRLQNEFSLSNKLLKQYKQTVDRSFIVSKTDINGIITFVNDAFCTISGYSKEELIGKPHSIISHPDMDRAVFKEMWYTIKTLKQPWVGEIKNRRKDKTAYWMRAVINPILDTEGKIVEYIGMRTDITQQKEIEQYFQNQLKISDINFNNSLQLSKEYEKAIDISTILSRTSKEGIITYANQKLLEISGYSYDELVGQHHNLISAFDTESDTYKNLWKTIKNGDVWYGIIENRTKSGGSFWTKTTVVPIKDTNNEILEYLAIRHDITEIVEQRRELEKSAKTDPLTGCGNRFRLLTDMQKMHNISAAIFNIDNFRQINDFYGQKFGDLIIKAIADKIYSKLAYDKNLRFYRLQGDEFIALGIEYEKESLIQKAKEILSVIKEKFKVANEEMLISCTCGISFEDKEHLLSTANMALKIAKKSNADYLIYDDTKSLNKMYEENLHWAKKLSDAIKRDDIITYYQPIVNNINKSYEKYESLVRMRDIEGKIISPFFFLEVSKQTRQYFDITKAVIRQSFEMFKDNDLEFSLNLSSKDILEPQISNFIFGMLDEYKIGSRVVFEIVESESIDNFEGVIHFIDQVKRYGAKIAIDDFGTGYSNFEYLIKLKADYLKIDGSLIKNLEHDKNAFVVVSTIVEFSKKLGMKTIAEFVENEKIFEIVKEMGIDYSQGYYFSEPKPLPQT